MQVSALVSSLTASYGEKEFFKIWNFSDYAVFRGLVLAVGSCNRAETLCTDSSRRGQSTGQFSELGVASNEVKIVGQKWGFLRQKIGSHDITFWAYLQFCSA